MIFFDHCYTRDDGHRFHKKLGRLGFTLNEKTVQHEGKAFCRFIMFATPPGSPQKFQYIEFVNVKAGGVPTRASGLLMGYKKGLEKFSKVLGKKLKIYSFHKNYNWLENT